eukprot:TRINITY_DN64_c3_g1_i1.p1 TRINITY_DN64_c3_g1~~TRINITY_DN64_c3_g1_i1.p1  ORF type:complete len:410 (-),score=-25.77 TRINITY_DN64_c3_g1_i1:642-1787(-)
MHTKHPDLLNQQKSLPSLRLPPQTAASLKYPHERYESLLKKKHTYYIKRICILNSNNKLRKALNKLSQNSLNDPPIFTNPLLHSIYARTTREEPTQKAFPRVQPVVVERDRRQKRLNPTKVCKGTASRLAGKGSSVVQSKANDGGLNVSGTNLPHMITTNSFYTPSLFPGGHRYNTVNKVEKAKFEYHVEETASGVSVVDTAANFNNSSSHTCDIAIQAGNEAPTIKPKKRSRVVLYSTFCRSQGAQQNLFSNSYFCYTCCQYLPFFPTLITLYSVNIMTMRQAKSQGNYQGKPYIEIQIICAHNDEQIDETWEVLPQKVSIPTQPLKGTRDPDQRRTRLKRSRRPLTYSTPTEPGPSTLRSSSRLCKVSASKPRTRPSSK